MRIAVLSIGSACDRDSTEVRASRLIRQLGLAVENELLSEEDVEALKEVWQRFDVVFLVDSDHSGMPCGTLRVLDAVQPTPGGGISRERRIQGEVAMSRLVEQLPRVMVLDLHADPHKYGCAVSPKDDAAGDEAAALLENHPESSKK